jgi:hypothetical protein
VLYQLSYTGQDCRGGILTESIVAIVVSPLPAVPRPPPDATALTIRWIGRTGMAWLTQAAVISMTVRNS